MSRRFYGHRVDDSNPFMTAIRVTPKKDVKAGGVYPVGGGWAFAESDTPAGKRGTFYIAGNLRLDCADGCTFADDEHAAIDPATSRVVPKGTPGAVLDIEIAVFVPRDGDNPPFALVYFEQPLTP